MDMKNELANYGIASFVAHKDIEPMWEWELEIRRALFSMDFLIALLTEEFSNSNWTDQEIGVAYGRRIPIIPIRIGKDRKWTKTQSMKAIPVSGVSEPGITRCLEQDERGTNRPLPDFKFHFQQQNDGIERHLLKKVYVDAIFSSQVVSFRQDYLGSGS